MSTAIFHLCLVIFASVVSAWEDCDASSAPDGQGVFPTSFEKVDSYQGRTIFLQYPSGCSPKEGGWPVIAFMHGMTLGWEWYAKHIQIWASHGFVIAVPFVKSPAQDDAIWPIVTETDASSLYKALNLLRSMANGSHPLPKGLQGSINMANIAIVGHSMGGENTIRASAGVRVPKGEEPLPAGAVKVTIAQHPSLCTFPPPHPLTISKEEINAASRNSALILFTAETDRAFLPWTPSTEHMCWQAATGAGIFASYSKDICNKWPSCSVINATRCTPKLAFVGSGHMCACDAPGVSTWTSPELKWVTTALRLYLHQQNATSSTCSSMLWGHESHSFRNDPNIAKAELHGPLSGAQLKKISVLV